MASHRMKLWGANFYLTRPLFGISLWTEFVKKTYSSLNNHNEATLFSSCSTIGLDAQPSARPKALQSSMLMGLDLVPSSIAAHTTISTRYAVSCAIPTLRMRNTTRQRLVHFHFHFPFPVSNPLHFLLFHIPGSKGHYGSWLFLLRQYLKVSRIYLVWRTFLG